MKTFKTFKEDMATGSAPANVSANIAGTGAKGAGIDAAIPGTNQAEPPGPKNILAKLFKRKRDGKIY